MHRFAFCSLVLLLLFAVNPAWGQWTVDNQNSRLSFVSIKVGTVAEVHHFGELQGTLAANGEFALAINLDSVETLIPIRNERMRDMLFETATYPQALLTAKVDMAAVDALGVGDQTEVATQTQLELSGRTTTLTVPTVVARLSANQLLVTSTQPLTLNTDMLGFGAGVEKLRQVAGLPSISPAVPVTFRLTLVADPS